ncbi:type VI secretion system contractile sheath large subunit [Vibrio spartinae]|uniref:Type VI secretion protein, EvpB/ family n=1 Tax=Vibrio spartinae TaxID=1918945 RepID=A0ABX6QYZ5_9VIBR|nr:type VI secretion system contractile sheath large subunit [Vibrio spartinae]QMV14493.1 type VI secretion protein, EvpB/ family [Vibrio spartinae]
MSDQTATNFIDNVLQSVNLITREESEGSASHSSAVQALLAKKKQKLTIDSLILAASHLASAPNDPGKENIEQYKAWQRCLAALGKVEAHFDDGAGNALLFYIDDLKAALPSLDATDNDLTKLTDFVGDKTKVKKLETAYNTVIAAIEEGESEEITEAIEAIEALKASSEYLESIGILATWTPAFVADKDKPMFELSIKETEVDRLLMQIAALSHTGCLPQSEAADASGAELLFELKENITNNTTAIDNAIQQELDNALHEPAFQHLEANWRALEYLIEQTDFSKDIKIDLLDVTKKELEDDFAENRRDIANSSLFKKLYTQEYDQYGGQPYSAMIGLYEFENSERDINWLRTMGKIANASHCTFVSSVGPKFFVGQDDINQLAEIKNLESHMLQGKFSKWNEFRDSDEAAYLAFTVPRFMIRAPYHIEDNPVPGLNYTEKVDDHHHYTWANAAMLFARNIVQSYEETSWCQTVRGPKNGGHIPNLTSHTFKQNGLTLTKVPVELVMPDYRELEFAKAGFMPLVYQKDTTNACFFSCQSIKKPKRFKDPRDTENSQLVTNLSYTLSITKIAHYIKCIMRDNIGGTADAPYITNTISNWLNNYVTTVVNPDDLTLRSYPFKAINVETVAQEGDIGWYKCTVSVSPHLQFEGLDAELRLETQL